MESPMSEPHLLNTFVAPRDSMFSGQEDAVSRTYRRIDGKRGVWLVAIQENEGDQVYFHNPKDLHSDGFGGATLKFILKDGTTYEARGPWKTGPEGLYSDTGYDCREKHFTRVVIGKGRSYDYSLDKYDGQCVIADVVYYEDAPVLGKFDRIADIVATLPPGAYFFWMETHGMTSSGKCK